MAATYSKYDNTPYYSLSSLIELTQAGTQAGTHSYSFGNDYVYTNLHDNVDKLISPKNLRDALLSLWDSNPFKETVASSSTFIGIDSGNPNDNDVKKPIYFGKRFLGNDEIMSDDLLNNRDNDIYFYNTRTETLDINQDSTRISFLSGSNSNIYQIAPFIESQYVIGATANYLSLDLVNQSFVGGDINILSRGIDPYTKLDTNSGGTVSINNIGFPTYQLNTSTNLDNKILTWNNGNLQWSDLVLPYNDWAGMTGSELNIYGSSVNLNGYSLEFTDSRYIPSQIGDIKYGETFNKKSIEEVLSRILYNYIPPFCELELNTNEYLEAGTSPNIVLTYRIYKNTNDTLPTLLTNMLPSQFPPISSDGQVVVSGQVEGIVIIPLNATSSSFTIRVDDGLNYNTATKTVTGVYPYYFGFSTQSTIKNKDLNTLNKRIEPKGDKSYDIFGKDNFYFIYDVDYGPLSTIYDNLGNNITSTFSHSIEVLSSPDGFWQSKEFYVYKWEGVQQIGPPSEIFQFKY